MKKGFQFLVSLALLVSLVSLSSCKKEEQGSSIQFTATMEDCADVHNAKTVLNGNVLQWVAGDEIIINSVNFTATPLNPPTMATFTTDANFTANETYVAYYPAENSFPWIPAVEISAEQESEDGSLWGFPMHAYSEGSTNLQFRNLCGVLKLVLQKPGVTVTSIALTVDQKINGIYDVENPTSAEATLSSIPRYNAGGRTTTLVCNQSINTAHDFYIYLPAGTYTGLKLEITASDGRVCTKGPATSSVVIERSMYSTLTLGGNDLMFETPGLLPGLFTINGEGDQVSFAQGNLQYQASTNTWRFAENQWDYVGDDSYGSVYENGVKCSNTNISATYNGWIDLFGWGTGNNPTITSTNLDDYGTFNDWGSNAISNGGSVANIWRTLTKDEWYYLFRTRTTTTNLGTANARCAKVQVNNVCGVIIFPDNYTHPTGINVPININPSVSTSGYGSSYTLAQWEEMEAAGAVFLPTTGYRWPNNEVNYANSYVRYWSCTPYTNDEKAYYTGVNNAGTTWRGSAERYFGYSVRLVRDNN